MKYQIQEAENPITDWVVVIIDDMPDNSALAQAALEFKGATVYTASNGPDGLALLDTLQPTVILLDIRMPKMDGWQVYERIRQNTALDPVPVIAITAYAMHKDRDDVLKAGFDGYITKPFDMFTFVNEVEHITTRARQKRQASGQS